MFPHPYLFCPLMFHRRRRFDVAFAFEPEALDVSPSYFLSPDVSPLTAFLRRRRFVVGLAVGLLSVVETSNSLQRISLDLS